ncbi:MAG TPA: hypothetical protein VKK31_12510 [Thermoanaerobaculia bacterium]|nr:hypothetical protein [Thermoanaerobaculia bacterium]
MKNRVLALAVVALFVTALTASAQTGTWTAVGSTGAVEPTQTGLFATFGGTRLGFAGGSGNTIVARFNVTNTWGLSDTPPWTTLEVGALNSSLNPVTATLYQVNPCSGARVQICRSVNDVAGSTGVCTTCTFSGNTFNFATFLYYVEVSISRTATTSSPQLSSLRIR